MDALTLLRFIKDLEMEIATWGSRNSQSNPGAVMELRDNKKKLAQLQAAYKKLVTPAESEKEKSK